MTKRIDLVVQKAKDAEEGMEAIFRALLQSILKTLRSFLPSVLFRQNRQQKTAQKQIEKGEEIDDSDTEIDPLAFYGAVERSFNNKSESGETLRRKSCLRSIHVSFRTNSLGASA